MNRVRRAGIRLLAAGSAAVAAAALVGGCGNDGNGGPSGNGGRFTLAVPVEAGEGVEEWYTRALERVIQVCLSADPPETVVVTVPEADASTSVAAEVEQLGLQLETPCSAFRPDGPAPAS